MCLRNVQRFSHHKRRRESETCTLGEKWNGHSELDLTVGVSKIIYRNIHFRVLKGVLEKRERKKILRGTGKKTGAVEMLGKRISTATPIQHEMWLISLENLLMLYGEESRGRIMEVHQELKRREFLTPWCSCGFRNYICKWSLI